MADAERLNKVMRKAGCVVGVELNTLETGAERTLSRLQAIRATITFLTCAILFYYNTV